MDNNIKKLDLYELKINPELESEVDEIAFVKSPAIEENYQYFSKTIEMKFVGNKDEMIIIGPAMIPNQRIYRKEGKKEFEVFFSVDTVMKTCQNFMKKGYTNKLNLDHTKTSANSYIFQSYIISDEHGLKSPVGTDYPQGTWIIGVKCENQNVWESIKKHERNGFSIQGNFITVPSNNVELNEDQEILSMLNQLEKILSTQGKKIK